MLRLLERVCLAALASATAGRWLLGIRGRRALRKQVSRYLQAIKDIEAKVGAKHVLDWKDVKEAPPASMDVSRLAPGEVSPAATLSHPRGDACFGCGTKVETR